MEMKKDSVRRIFIMTTYNCNLHCRYCYEPVKVNTFMDVEKICAALTNEFTRLRQFDSFRLTFHGGEPFLYFDRIKEVCEWAWNAYPNLDITADAPTNGTVLNEDIRQWLRLNCRRFEVSVSVDGDKETHNFSRGDSYERIDWAFFLSLPGIKAKMTVVPEMIGKMMENYLFLKEKGMRVAPSLAKGANWDRTKHLPEYAEQLNFFINYLLDNPEENLPPLLAYDISKLARRNQGRSMHNCGVGYNEVAYDIKGKYYPCHAFITDFGKETDNNELKAIIHRIETSSQNELVPKCSTCLFSSVCGPCYGLNYTQRGSISNIDESFCPFIQVSILATANLYARALVSDKKYVWLEERTPQDVLDIIEAIKILNTTSHVQL